MYAYPLKTDRELLELYAVVMQDDRIPLSIRIDVINRIGDWTLSGGSVCDPYVTNQIKYLNRVLKYERSKHG